MGPKSQEIADLKRQLSAKDKLLRANQEIENLKRQLSAKDKLLLSAKDKLLRANQEILNLKRQLSAKDKLLRAKDKPNPQKVQTPKSDSDSSSIGSYYSCN